MTEITKSINVFNNAGKKKQSPLLRGLGLRFVHIPSYGSGVGAPVVTLRPLAATEEAAEADLSLSVTPSLFQEGNNGTLDTYGRFSDPVIGDWASSGLAAGDFIYIKDTSGDMKTGLYEVADVGLPSAEYCRFYNPYREDGQLLWPFDGSKTGLTWNYCFLLAYDSSNGLVQPGIANTIRDALNVAVEHEVTFKDGTDILRGRFFVRDAPDSEIILFDGLSWDGFTTTKQGDDRIALSFLRSVGWVGVGGIGTVEIVSSTDFYWDSGHTKQGEERVGLAKTMGVYVTSGTGTKTGTFRLRSRFGDTIYRDVAVTITVVASDVDKLNKEKA